MCMLIDELKKLKKSSLESVDNEKEFTEFKRYMHVHRKVESDLIDTIKKARQSEKKSLILVCGNVGDGKSHLLSYLKNGDEHYLDGFTVHNDATESFSRFMTEKQTLAKVLDEFNDDNLFNGSNVKVIIAINLGVLNNFIEAEEGENFTRLTTYVHANKILTDTAIIDKKDANGIFFHVNFGDYHIYCLNNAKIESPFINQIIDKIFKPIGNNEFYAAYQCCSSCELYDRCPVKHNFEMLQNESVKAGLINIILETIVKDKIILSTRDLLNFIYDFTVHSAFNLKKFSKLKGNELLETYIKYSLPSMLYEHADLSLITAHISKYDYLNQSSASFDDITTIFNTVDDVSSVFTEYINSNPCMTYALSQNLNDKANKNFQSGKQFRKDLFKYFARLCKLAGKPEKIETINFEFHQFIADLFYARKNRIQKLSNIYTSVEKCIFAWNGSNDVSHFNLNTENENYIISSNLKLLPNITQGQLDECNVFERFPAYIIVSFCSESEPLKGASLSIDYDLYEMIMKVKNGYRPSTKDTNTFIGFVAFMNKISSFGKYDKEIIVRQFRHEHVKEYVLKKSAFGTYEFMEV